jgi:ketosteroid isomerase-like protein
MGALWRNAAAAGHRVLANNERGIVLTAERAEHDGNPLEYTAVHVWGVRAGKLARFAAYNDDAYNAYWR